MWGQLEFSRSKHFSWARIAKLLGIWDRTLKRQREEFGYFNFRSISESGYSQIKCACMYTVDGNSRQTYTYIVLTSIWLQRYLTYLKCIWRIFLFISSIKSPQCADECSKTIFFDSDFPSPCFDVPKASNFTSGGVQNGDTKKQETGTGNDFDVNLGLQASRKTDFSVIFLLWANQFAKEWYNSALFMSK